ATPPSVSSAQAEPLDERPVALDVLLLYVVEQAAAAADQQKQTTTAVVVVLVHLEVLGQVGDPLGEHRDLHLGRAGVALLRRVLGHDPVLGLCVERHVSNFCLPGYRSAPTASSRHAEPVRRVTDVTPSLPAGHRSSARVCSTSSAICATSG